MAPDIMTAQPTFKHERNVIVLPFLLPHDLNIYGMNKDWAVEAGREGNKTEQGNYCLQSEHFQDIQREQ